MDTPSLAELEQHAALLKDRVLGIATEIKALLAEDLPQFVERELKKGFVNNPDFASSVSDDELKALKKELSDKGPKAAKTVLEALEVESLWFPENVSEGDPKSISDNTSLWGQVNAISATVVQIMDAHSFPKPETAVEYKSPTWFIGRRYLPSLSEKYWRLLRELGAVQSQIDSICTESSKDELTKRWEDL